MIKQYAVKLSYDNLHDPKLLTETILVDAEDAQEAVIKTLSFFSY
jgi:hypothetical protein